MQHPQRSRDSVIDRRRSSRPAALVAALSLLLLAALAPSLRAADEDPFVGRVAVITGTSSGLGRELAEIAAAREMRLVLVDIDAGPSEAMARRIVQEGGEAVFVEADLADPAQRGQIIETAVERFGTVDYLFNNAGYSYLATLEQMDLDMAHHLMEVNYWAYVDLAQAAIAVMKEQGSGTIYNTSSILGVRPGPPGLGHYAATKFALVGMFQVVAREVAPYGIRVFVGAPAGMRTNISKNSVGPLADPELDRAADWEDPAIAAEDIFAGLLGDEVMLYPGYIGREMGDESD
ncbi:MAG TPA: SDR family oxidoreductase [Pseudomonadales bacterium]|nr:SDR family oxidoreductase [Pseudomonadales bacterium]